MKHLSKKEPYLIVSNTILIQLKLYVPNAKANIFSTPEENECVLCDKVSPRCSKCSFNQTFSCDECLSDEYKLIDGKECEKCNLKNCEKCNYLNGKQTCEKCLEDYYLGSEGQCNECYEVSISEANGWCKICSEEKNGSVSYDNYDIKSCNCNSSYALTDRNECLKYLEYCAEGFYNNITNEILCSECDMK